jgi:hypothetical protein
MESKVIDNALQIFTRWYSELPITRGKEGPAGGSIAAALVVLERLQSDFVLNLSAHQTTRGKMQIAGLSATAVGIILAKFGETREFLREAGRTNRGVPGDIGRMLKTIKEIHLDQLSLKDRNAVLREFQKFLTDRVRDFHNRQKIQVTYDQSLSSWQFVNAMLKAASETGKEGQVAQYLVGAKLELRYPDIIIENYSSSTADQQLGRHGDFQVNDTIFHVTVSPMPAIYDKCRANINAGFRVYLLVPDRNLPLAKGNAEMHLAGKIFVESIESFVGQNVEELSQFSRQRIITEFRKLLDIYNRRVNSVELDKSLLITIPPNIAI